MDIKDCIFCQLPKERIIAENEHCLAFHDLYPVTDKHTLIIPKAHRTDYFELTPEELDSVNDLIKQQKEKILLEDKNVTGFNIGANCGEDAGQTVFHCHIHLIPRRKGDMENPKGGVRHVIPDKGHY